MDKFIQANISQKRFERKRSPIKSLDQITYSTRKLTTQSQTQLPLNSKIVTNTTLNKKNHLLVENVEEKNLKSKLRKKGMGERKKYFIHNQQYDHYFAGSRIKTSTHDISLSLPESEKVQLLEEQNCELRTKLLDNQIKERNYVQKINELQSLCLRLKESMEKKKFKQKSEQEQRFLNVVRKTYNDYFQVSDLKEIWKCEKKILDFWIKNHQR